MIMGEQICLQWNDFKDIVSTSFRSLRDDRDFADVTLACEDGKQMEAHKVILAFSSPVFKNLLQKNKHEHPLIYMRGASSDILIAILDFLYFGEANVPEESLDGFLALGAELRMKGLVLGAENKKGKKRKVTKSDLPPKGSAPKTEPKTYSSSEQELHGGIPTNEAQNEGMGVGSAPNDLNEYTRELDLKVKSLMTKSQNTISKQGRQERADTCRVCGKEGQWVTIRDHIESKHLEGISLPCSLCDKTYKSRGSLKMHIYNYHK